MRLIDVDALRKKVKTECNPYGKPTINFDDGCKVLDMIDNSPTIEERKTGHWIHIRTEEDGNTYYECSVCHKGVCYVPIIVEVPFCWNCGAKMEVKNDV